MRRVLFVPERFRRAIQLHLIKNMLPWADGYVPLILGIHGPSGYGKTFQCEAVLAEMGVKTFPISGGQLESPDAGAPSRLIRGVYKLAHESIAKSECVAATVLINDIDTAIGDFGEMVQKTINWQNVLVELMDRADHPRHLAGIATNRIPFIVTGNDFTKLYGPLTRAGRMTAFEWIPTRDEVAAILQPVFPSLQFSELHELISAFPNEPLAFFTTLHSAVLDEHVYNAIRSDGVHQVIQRLRKGENLRVDSAYTLQRLMAIANAQFEAGAYVNHLGR